MNKTFSANMIKIFDECPQKYHLIYEEGISLPQDKTPAREGENLHALISYYLKGYNINKLVNSLNEKEQALWQNFLKLNISKNDVESCEETFNYNFDGTNWLTGRIDSILKEENKFAIYDWKTGKLLTNSEKSPQTIIYLFSMFSKLKNQNKIKNHTDLKMVYYNLKTLEKTEVKLDEKYYNDIKYYICNKIAKINEYSSKALPRREKKHCQNCKLKMFCNYNES